MADTLLLKAIRSQPKCLNLTSKRLRKVPKAIGQLNKVTQVLLKNNQLTDLPKEFASLAQLESLNIGNNNLEHIPEVLQYLESLQTLHLFNNDITHISADVIWPLKNLKFLNLNQNHLQKLPAEICRLTNLEHLSVDNNELIELPVELCALTNLRELHAAYNQLTTLPLEFGFLMNLERLHLQRNKIKELPESMGKLYKLKTLDIAANDLRIFPTEITNLPLREIHFEANPLLQHMPVHSIQEEEVLGFKEMIARFIMKELKDRSSYLRVQIKYYPQVRDILAQSSKCSVCSESFLNTWLECVRFIDTKKTMKTSNGGGLIPVRALLCSYKCFNSTGHQYYGVAFP